MNDLRIPIFALTAFLWARKRFQLLSRMTNEWLVKGFLEFPLGVATNEQKRTLELTCFLFINIDVNHLTTET
jgi:hypothetical protein